MVAQPELPTCCQQRGLFFADRQRRCPRHQSREDKALVAELDRKAKPIIGRNGGWPYGPNIDVESRQGLVEWASHHRLTLSTSSRKCLHWLRGKRCDPTSCRRHDGLDGSWLDHVTCWLHSGQPAVFLAQPYGLRGGDLVELGRLASEPGLDVYVGDRNWYGWGTVGVEVWLTSVRERVDAARSRERDSMPASPLMSN